MSKPFSEIEKELDIKETILNFILEGVDGVENIKEVEENCGSLWITLKDGDVYYVSVDKTESYD